MGRTSAEQRRERWTQEFLAEGPAGPIVRLNLTKRKAFLNVDQGEVSELVGVDVLRPWRRGDPRRPVGNGAVLGYVERPVVDAQGSSFRGLGASVFQAQYLNTEGSFLHNGTGELRIGTRLYPQIFGGLGWPTTMLGAAFAAIRGQTQWGSEQTYVSGFKTTNLTNDTLLLTPALTLVMNQLTDTFRITSVIDRDYRGILASNGRRIHLFQGGVYGQTPFLEIAEARHGDRWRGVRISNSRMMFVSDRNVPRIVQLAGPRNVVPSVAIDNATWTAGTKTISAAPTQFTRYNWRSGDRLVITAGTLEFLGSYEIASKVNDSGITLVNSCSNVNATGIAGYIVRGVEQDTFQYAGPILPFTARKPQEGPAEGGPYATTAGGGSTSVGFAAIRMRLLDLESNAASPFYQVPFLFNGSLIPRLSIAANQKLVLNNLTLGKVGLHRRAHLLQIWRKLSGGSDYFLEIEVPLEYIASSAGAIELFLSDADLSEKQILLSAEVNRGVPPAGRDIAVLGDTGTVLIAGKTDKANFANPIIEGLEYLWPTVDNDNVVHFSRTDAFDPENFPPSVSNQIVLSAIGDRFQRFAVSGEEVLAVMEHGVYALASGGALGVQRKVIAERGLGTPWPESVFSADRFAGWVNPQNVYLYDASAAEESTDRLTTVGDDIRDWLLEAHRSGDQIQCAYDARRGVLIVRRLHSDGTYTDWERHLRTEQSVMMLDRSGVRIVDSTYANTSPSEQPLPYSVDGSGAVMEIGHKFLPGDSHPFDGGTVQAALDVSYTRTSVSIGKAAAFKTAMMGEVLRIRSSNPLLDGQRRVITALQNDGSTLGRSNEGGPMPLVALEMLTQDLGVLAFKNAAAAIHVMPLRLSATGAVTLGTPLILNSTGGDSLSLSAESPTRCWLAFHDGNQVKAHTLTVNKEFIVASASITVVSDTNFSSKCSIAGISARKAVLAYQNDSNSAIRFVVILATRDGTLSKGQHLEIAASSISSAMTAVCRASDVGFFAVWNELLGKIAYLTVTGSQIALSSQINIEAAQSTAEFALQRFSDTMAVVSYRTLTNVGKINVAVVTNGALSFPNPAQQYLAADNTRHSLAVQDLLQGTLIYRRISDGAGVVQPFAILNGGAGGVFIDPALAIVYQANSSPHALARSNAQHFVIAYQDGASANTVSTKVGIVYGGTVSVGAVNIGPPDFVAFDQSLSGLVNGDEFIIGAVPFKVRFAPVIGDRMRNAKQIDGLSVWAAPDGRTVTTTKKVRARVYRDLGSAPAALNSAAATSVDMPIKAASEADATDEGMYADLSVDGKALELELSNEDADVGFALNNVAAVMTQRGDLTGDRSTTS